MAREELHHFVPFGEMFARPLFTRVRATFTASGATCTVSSTRRQSHPAAITGSAGTYAVTGLPQGSDYHIVAVSLNPGTGTKLINQANVSAFSAADGTLTFLTRQSSDGAVTAPADNTVVYITLVAETGLPS